MANSPPSAPPPIPASLYTTQAQFMERFRAFTERMKSVVAPKNQDYAGSDDAFANLRRHGLYGVLVRMEDKISRLNGFVTRDGKLQVTTEKAEDTATDLANYAGILVIMIGEIMAAEHQRTINLGSLDRTPLNHMEDAP